MLKIAEYNTITGEKVELKELEKYGFEYRIKTNEYYFKINGSEHLEIPVDKESNSYKEVRLFIEDEYYNCWTSFNSFDKLYDLIKDGFIIKED
jgi:hypothetical protein